MAGGTDGWRDGWFAASSRPKCRKKLAVKVGKLWMIFLDLLLSSTSFDETLIIH